MISDALPSYLNSIATPALVLRAEVVQNNIRRLSEYARKTGIRVRPHTKTHKLRAIAQMQLEAGAIGLTAAKVSEAAAVSSPGEDVLLAYPPIGPHRARDAAELAGDRVIRVAADSVEAVEIISAAAKAAGTTVGVLVDIDVGLRRTGVRTPNTSLTLASAIQQASNLTLDGIMIYPGHIYDPPSAIAVRMQEVCIVLNETLDLWKCNGVMAEIVSGGSTPTAYWSHLIPALTEIRPGAYVFNDMNTVRCGYCTLDDCAAFIVATVVSTAVHGQVVVDAGSKSLTRDPSSHSDCGFGHVIEYPEARITRLSEEHGQVDVSACHPMPKIGDRLRIVPNHICPCVNLHDKVWWVEDSESPRALSVDARGRVL